jgi:sugar/nucleoside kinase (ribokinase family)
MTPRTPVVVVGDLMLDVVAVAAEDLHHASDTAAQVVLRGGGSAANVATWLASTGEDAVLVARAGQDEAGRGVLDVLRLAGVEVRIALDPRARTGACVVLVEPGGERTMLPDRGANLLLSPADLPLDRFVAGGHLHLAGYALLHPGPRPAALEALAQARAAGMTISLDPSSAAPLREVGARPFLEWAREADLVVPNADEAHELTGEEDPGRAARTIAQHIGGEAVVTLGAAGAVWSDGDAVVSGPGARVRDVQDSTGAGDAFAAGLIGARRRGDDVPSALEAANALAARAVAQPGARPAPPPLLHVAERDAWEAAQPGGRYPVPGGGPFIHLCFPHQLPGVLERFFAGADRSRLLLLDVAPAGLPIHVEPAADGTGHYPHLYAELPVAAVRGIRGVPRG